MIALADDTPTQRETPGKGTIERVSLAGPAGGPRLLSHEVGFIPLFIKIKTMVVIPKTGW
jgi:hypothetical protein